MNNRGNSYIWIAIVVAIVIITGVYFMSVGGDTTVDTETEVGTEMENQNGDTMEGDAMMEGDSMEGDSAEGDAMMEE